MGQQKRATFIDVGNAQDILDDLIETYIQNNRPLTKEEQKHFKKIFRLATLGICSEHRFFLKTKKGVHDLGYAGHATRWLIKQKHNPIHFSDPDENIPLKNIWRQLLDIFDKIYDPAINESVKISKEQTWQGPAKAGEV